MGIRPTTIRYVPSYPSGMEGTESSVPLYPPEGILTPRTIGTADELRLHGGNPVRKSIFPPGMKIAPHASTTLLPSALELMLTPTRMGLRTFGLAGLTLIASSDCGVAVGVRVGVRVGTGVTVGVLVGPCVGVLVGVGVGPVGVGVGVAVGVLVGVEVGIGVRVGVGVGGLTITKPGLVHETDCPSGLVTRMP